MKKKIIILILLIIGLISLLLYHTLATDITMKETTGEVISSPDTYGSWNGDTSLFFGSSFSWLHRGGYCYATQEAGVFGFIGASGMGDETASTRPSLIVY